MRVLRQAIVFSFALAACSDPPPPEPAAKPRPASPRPNRAMPIGPGAAMNTDKPDMTRVGIDLANARKEIKMYLMVNGKLPPNLAALDLRPVFPADLIYNQRTGRVASRTFPKL